MQGSDMREPGREKRGWAEQGRVICPACESKNRLLHWAHHRDLGGRDDPKYSYSVDIRGYRLARFLLTCLIGIEAVRQFSYQRQTVKKSSSVLWILRVPVFQKLCPSPHCSRSAYWSAAGKPPHRAAACGGEPTRASTPACV